MSNFSTVAAITENILGLLKASGIHFSRKVRDDEKNLPASLLPAGELLYRGERFGYTHGERPGYIEAAFTVKIILGERDPVRLMEEEQRWVHRIRESLTVAGMNTGALAAERPVSRVTAESVDVTGREHSSTLRYRLSVRYREA